MLLHTSRARHLAMLIIVTAIGLVPMPTPEPAVAIPDYSASDVTFENDHTAFQGRVLVPSDQAAHRPAVVIVAGSGSREMDDYLREAEAFVAAGVVALIYDKRTDGYSLTQRSFRQLGDDALAALEVLRSRPDVDPDRVGLWGHSEGGWVVPLAASRSENVAFVVVAGASALAPARAQTWSTCRYLIHSGFTDRACGSLGVNLTRVMVAAGVFPEAVYDPLPALTSLDIPVLAVFAEHDQSTAPAESRELMKFALADNPNPHTALRVIPDVDHNFVNSSDGFAERGGLQLGYLHLLGTWVVGLDEPPVTVNSDPAPAQAGRTSPPSELAGFESLPAQGVALSMLLLGFSTYGVGGLVRRIRRMPMNRGIAVPSRLLMACGLVSVLGTLGFLGFVISTGAANSLGPVALGRPVVWLGLQLLAATTIGATAWLAIASWRARGTPSRRPAVRTYALLAAGAVFIPWSLYWGMLTP